MVVVFSLKPIKEKDGLMRKGQRVRIDFYCAFAPFQKEGFRLIICPSFVEDGGIAQVLLVKREPGVAENPVPKKHESP